MILVVFGNVPIPFPRLAEKIAEISWSSTERFIIQKGFTQYSFPKAESFEFFPATEMSRLIRESEVIITHGGYGTISEAMKMGKKIIAVPRLEGEHNHSQRELVEALEKEGYLLAVYDIADLEKQISAARNYSSQPIQLGNAAQLMSEFIRKAFPAS